MLSGVGDHYEGMARGLYQSEQIFKEEVDRCCELLLPLIGTDLRKLIFADDSQQKTQDCDRPMQHSTCTVLLLLQSSTQPAVERDCETVSADSVSA